MSGEAPQEPCEGAAGGKGCARFTYVAGRGVVERLAMDVDGFFRARAVPPRAAHALALSLEEVVANVVEHTAGGGDGVTVSVRLWREEDRVFAEVRDNARAFDPLRDAPRRVWEESVERPGGRGLGLELVRRLVEVLTYYREGGENVLRLEKHIGG